MAEGITVHLGGRLGTLFGKEWKGLRVSSPAEAFRAIDINTKGRFRQYLAKDPKREYHVTIQKKSAETCLSAEELKHRTGNGDIYLLPAIQGRNNGWVKIVAGAVLVVIGVAIDYFSGGSLSLLGNAFIAMGSSLILGGITQLLTPIPKQNQQLQSYNFQGNATTVNQGGCVPIFYGRYLISPVPICVSFSASDINYSTNNIQGGTVTSSYSSNGNGVQYGPGDTTYPTVPAPIGFVPPYSGDG